MEKNKYEKLIVDIISKNDRYRGNEDLLKFIYDDVIERLGGILDTISDEVVARGYIERIVKLSVITVVKKRGMLVSDTVVKPSLVKEKTRATVTSVYSVFDYSPSEEVIISSLSDAELKDVEEGIKKLNETSSSEDFVKLYQLRYIEKKSLESISNELSLSQSLVAERLFDLTALVKRICGNEVSQV